MVFCFCAVFFSLQAELSYCILLLYYFFSLPAELSVLYKIIIRFHEGSP
jgi:hypothetical protein